MGRLLVVVTLAALVVMAGAGAWLGWRTGRRLPLGRRLAAAALGGALAAAPGAALGAFVVWVAAWFTRRYPGVMGGLRGAVRAEAFAPGLYDLEAPSCAR